MRIRDRLARAFRPVLIVRDFLRDRRDLVPSVVLGLIAGIIVSHAVPVIGKFAGDIILAFAVAYGVTKRR